MSDRKTCPRCNGHGFLIKREESFRSLMFDSFFRLCAMMCTPRTYYEAPTDAEAEQDLSDFDLKSCRCFFGTVRV